MLERNDFNARVDIESRRIVRENPGYAGDVAILGSAVKSALKRDWSAITGNSHVQQPSQLLDMCLHIDAHAQWHPSDELLPHVEKARAHSLTKLMDLLYERKMTADPDQQMNLREEKQLATMLAKWLPAWRKILPQQGMIGPAWMAEHCPQALWERIQWYVHNLETGVDEWQKFVDLLPMDIRRSFSPRLIPLVLPKKLTTPEEAVALAEHIAMETGMSVNKVLLPESCKQLIATHKKAYTLLLRFGVERVSKREKAALVSEQQSVQSTEEQAEETE